MTSPFADGFKEGYEWGSNLPKRVLYPARIGFWTLITYAVFRSVKKRRS